MGIFAAAAPFVAPVVSGVGAYLSGRDQREADREAAEKAMQFAQASAREQMAFQERMSGTAYQRSTADMKKAGINPMLAYMQGGASSPVGSSASGTAISTLVKKFDANVSSAIDSVRLRQEIAESRSRMNSQEAQAEMSRAAAESERASARLKDAEFFPKAKFNEFLNNHPWYLKSQKFLELFGSAFGSARDVALTYRGIKGFESDSGPRSNVLKRGREYDGFIK